MENENILNDLGKIIKRRKELGIPQERISNIFEKTKQWWSNIEKKYEESNGNHTIPITYEQRIKLNQLLEFSSKDALSGDIEPLIFDESKVILSAFEDARKRDYALTQGVLECICSANDDDLAVLSQTVFVIIRHQGRKRSDFFDAFLASVRNSITQSTREFVKADRIQKDIIPKLREEIEGTTTSASTQDNAYIEETIKREKIKYAVYSQLLEKIKTEGRLQDAISSVLDYYWNGHFC